MPRSTVPQVPGAAYSSRGGRGPGGLSSQEAAGIAILAIVIAVLFIAGCWYFKRRSGYKILRSRQFGPGTTFQSFFGGPHEEGVPLDSKRNLPEYSRVDPGYPVPDAPPAYDKVSAEAAMPPPYSP